MIPVVTADPAPFDVAIDHNLTPIWSATINGPVIHCSEIVNGAIESLSAIAVRAGADGVYSVRLSTAIDHGWMFVTAAGTASLPILPTRIDCR